MHFICILRHIPPLTHASSHTYGMFTPVSSVSNDNHQQDINWLSLMTTNTRISDAHRWDIPWLSSMLDV